MNDVRFAEPVCIEIPHMDRRKVASSFEALECLDQQWPEWARGRSWRAAHRVCRDALDGWCSAHEARKAFFKAARRAGLIWTQPRHREADGKSHALAGESLHCQTGSQTADIRHS